METPELVMTDGDGFDSDESSFYGDDETKAHFESLAAAFDPSAYKSIKRVDPNAVAAQGRAARTSTHEATAQLHNPGTGQVSAWQTSETAKDFLARIPPASRMATRFKWLEVHNPHLGKDHVVYTRKVDRKTALAAGHQILESLEKKSEQLKAETPGLTGRGITRKMADARKDAEREIHQEANQKNMRGGAWLLFPTASDLDKTWMKVVEGTIAGDLGVSAWVGQAGELGRDSSMAPSKKSKEKVLWTIRISTQDFQNKDDIGRVLSSLREKKIIGSREAILYKTDILFELDIYTVNNWGISPVLYSAKDFQGRAKR